LIPVLINSGTSLEQQNHIYSVEKDEIVAYLSNYLEKRHCSLILSEKQYIDKEYLADFASFHLKAFAHYKKTCSRVHFFTGVCYDEIDDFKRALLLSPNFGLSHCFFQERYLGFVVVKPLPNHFIGRTCIKPEFQEGANIFAYQYKSNIHGLELFIHSLPFQAQDPSIGVCASVSLWSALKGASKIFDDLVVPNIGKITDIADKIVPTTQRVYPSSGLRPTQMVQVIKQLDLEVEYRDWYNPIFRNKLKEIIKGYCAIKLPAILLLNLKRYPSSSPSYIPNHAVALSGYKINNRPIKEYQNSQFYLKAENMDMLYIHDDNGGPFLECPLEFDEVNNVYSLKIPRYNHNFPFPLVDGKEIAVICGIIFPVYNKIRVDFEHVIFNMVKIDQLFKIFFEQMMQKASPITWDIELLTISDFKQAFKDEFLDEDTKMEIICSNYPRFIWRCSCFTGDDSTKKVFEILEDATGLPNATYIFKIYFFDNEILKAFKQFINQDDLNSYIISILKIEDDFMILKEKINALPS